MVYLDLAIALSALGHQVTMVAPAGTDFPNVAPMECSNGTATPTATYCEVQALHTHKALFDSADIIHDWSIEKHAAEWYPDKSVSTVLSGNFDRPRHGRNVCVWSKEMQERAYRGASDYEGTEFTQWQSTSRALADAHVVPGGVDTEFWCPGIACGTAVDTVGPFLPKDLFQPPRDIPLLWLGRWHEARGYGLAIDLARRNPSIELVMCGEHPDNATNEHQRGCALDAEQQSRDVPNVRMMWLPKERHREAVRAMYRRACAYLFTPRMREPFGLSQAEALACGTPVVGCNIGSVPEVIEHGVTGFVVEPAFLAQACAKVGHIDPAVCREQAVKRFDRSVMAQAYVREYQAVLDGKGWG